MSTLLVVVLLSASGCFLLSNLPPLPALQADPLTGEAPLLVHFDASGSDDPDGIVIVYQWSFGDGTSDSDQTVDHMFNVPGTYVVQLTIEDDRRTEASLSITVVVEASNTPPSAAFSFAPSPATQASPVRFDASASTDVDGAIVAYAWDFGDGDVDAGPLVEHVFPEPGLRNVTLTVTDNHGATQQRTLAIVVSEPNGQAPSEQATVAYFAPKSITIGVGETVQLDASASTSASGGITSYEWGFGDGFTAAGMAVGHAYSAAGSYQVTLTVTDSLGGSAQATGTIKVATAPPADGDGMYSRSFSWWYQGRTWSLYLSISQALYDEAIGELRSLWPNRNYSKYINDPGDNLLLQAIIQDCRFDCYFSTIKNAFAFVQGAIDDQPDEPAFDYPQYPVETLVNGAGDSEDTAILYASLIRTMGYRPLLAAADTNNDGVSDQLIVLVPVGDNFARYGIPEAWRYDGMNYAFGVTGSGGSTRLGSDPWNLTSSDIEMLWDGSYLDSTPQLVKQ